MTPETERLLQNELRYRRARRSPLWAILLLGFGLFVPFYSFWILGAALRFFGLQ